jgi:hypothetical protein
LLRQIATLEGEDRRAWLLAALAAYDEALRCSRPNEIGHLAYAETQDNRASLLSEIAELPGENRHGWLLVSLAACDEALRFLDSSGISDSARLAIQNRRAGILEKLANLQGEDRRARLREALAACDEALNAIVRVLYPLDYAIMQANRAALLREIATLRGEDRHACLLGALNCIRAALSILEPTGNIPLVQNVIHELKQLCQESGELFPELWAESSVEDLSEYERSTHEGYTTPLVNWAKLSVGESLEWLLSTPERIIITQAVLDFAHSSSLAEMRELVQANPVLSTDRIEPIFANLLEEWHEYKETVDHITQHRDLLRACREYGVAAVFDALDHA